MFQLGNWICAHSLTINIIIMWVNLNKNYEIA